LYEWLRFWKTQAPKERIVCSSFPITVYANNIDPDNIFSPIIIESAYDFMEKYYGLRTGIPHIETENTYWKELLSHVMNKSFDFNQFVKKRFNIHELSIQGFLNKWTSFDSKPFDRWLLKNFYLLNCSNEKSYLSSIIKDCVDYSSLRIFREISLAIFADTNADAWIKERNELLLLFDRQYELPQSDILEMEDEVQIIAQKDIHKAISLCSGRFDFEKDLFIRWHALGELSTQELQKLYPDFSTYLGGSTVETFWVAEYIQAYKQAKIRDSYTNNIQNIISKMNGNETNFYNWYYTFESPMELLSKEIVKSVYWVDGLGIEYLALIESLIHQSTFNIDKIMIAKANIPSSTEHNKFDNVEKIEDLDKYIHADLYQYPQTIRKEIDIVIRIISRILNQSVGTSIAIVADHGLTALSRLVPSKKYAVKAGHEGRYIKLEGAECIEDSDYIRLKNGGTSYKVALTHASLNSKPLREVHGGCTPEEVLVPFIVISNKEKERHDQSLQTSNANNVEMNSVPKKQTVGFEEEEYF
jgi:hypothetical protein